MKVIYIILPLFQGSASDHLGTTGASNSPYKDSITTYAIIKDSLMKMLSFNDSLIGSDTTGSTWPPLITADSLLVLSITTLDSVAAQYYDSAAQFQYNLVFTAKGLNAKLDPTTAGLPGGNKIAMNDILVNTLDAGVDTFTSTQIASLAELAFQCPLIGGDAVFKARAVYSLITDTVYDDIALCDTSIHDDRMMLVKPHTNISDTVPVLYKLFPNPAKDEVKILCNNPFDANSRLIVYDVEGRHVLDYALPAGQYMAQFNTNSLPAASYITNIVTGNLVKFRSKLLIMK